MAAYPPQANPGDVIVSSNHNGLRDNVVRKKTALEGQLFYTQGSVLFADSSGFLDEDNTNLFWDDTNNRLKVGGGTVPTWRKFTILETALTAMATDEGVDLFTVSEFEKVMAVTIKHSASFTGGSLTAFTVSVGSAGNATFYSAALDIFQAPSITAFLDTDMFKSQNMAGIGNISRAYFVSTGDNVLNATAGSVDIWVLTTVLP